MSNPLADLTPAQSQQVMDYLNLHEGTDFAILARIISTTLGVQIAEKEVYEFYVDQTCKC